MYRVAIGLPSSLRPAQVGAGLMSGGLAFAADRTRASLCARRDHG